MIQNKRFSILSLTLLVGLVVSSLSVLVTGPQVSAAPVTGFKAGNIMSDQVFTNYRSMSKNDIQRFLNAKGSGCSGSLCLKNYQQGGRSAAQIIYDTSQTYRINPQVFIVLLQKEVGLVTDTDPQSWQYRTATGYGCPDTAACDSQYYGFTNQLKWSGTMFRSILDDSPTWYAPYTVGNNRVYYHPDLSRCGSSTVNIQNRTTAALYSYTPYQPNQASLDAGYGTGNSCSSYGNRNFYQYFKDWFGSTYVPLVFKTTESDQAYLLSGNKYVRIPSPTMLYAYGFSKSDIGTVTPNMLGLFEDGGTLKNITRFGGSSAIYLIDRGKRLQFPSRAMYETYGYEMGDEIDLDAGLLSEIAAGQLLTDTLRADSQTAIYLMENNNKRHISSHSAYTTMGDPVYSSRARTILSQDYVNTKPVGAPIVVAGSVVRDSTNGNVYFWDGSGLQGIDNRTVNELGVAIDYTSSTVEQLPASGRPTVNQLIKDTDNTLYVLNGRQKLAVSPSDLTNLGISATSFVTVPAGFVSALSVPNTPFVALFRVNGTDPIYTIKDGERFHLTSQTALTEQGFTVSQTLNFNSRTAALFPDSGKKILAQGQLFRIGQADAVYIVATSSSSLHVPSLSLIKAYGYSMDDVQSLSSSQVSNYADSGTLGYFSKDQASQVWFIDSGGKKRSVSGDISGSSVYNINIATLPVLSDTLLGYMATQPAMTNLIKAEGQNEVYKIENGTKRWITTREAMESRGLLYDDVRIVSASFKDSLPTGQPLN
jgi:hypothetical protein